MFYDETFSALEHSESKPLKHYFYSWKVKNDCSLSLRLCLKAKTFSSPTALLMFFLFNKMFHLSFLISVLCVFRCLPGFLGEYCQHKDPCHPGFCLNGGNCSVSLSAGVPVPGSATCTCPLGFTGQHCQTPQNSTCYPNNPCANRGNCILLSLDKYRCECARGWTGEAQCPLKVCFDACDQYLFNLFAFWVVI